MFSQPVVASIDTQWVRLAEGVDVYVAAPEDGNALGGVIVAGEIFGITTHVRDICERLARAGYLVAAPDFYWRQQRGTCLSYDARGRKAGMRMLRLLQRGEVVSDVAGARHGFLCTERSVTFDAEASADVWRRLLGALAAHVVHAQRSTDG